MAQILNDKDLDRYRKNLSKAIDDLSREKYVDITPPKEALKPIQEEEFKNQLDKASTSFNDKKDKG